VTKSIKVICIAAISLSIIGCSDSGSETVEPNQQITQEMPKAETPQVTSPSESVSAAKVEPATAKIRSADSHVHGGATLSVVSEKNLVMVELEKKQRNLTTTATRMKMTMIINMMTARMNIMMSIMTTKTQMTMTTIRVIRMF